jgi:tRNA A37 threonylcarbamoyladenosine biosynthesis protein TsaE
MSILFSDTTQWNNMPLTGKIFITLKTKNPKFDAVIEELQHMHKRMFNRPMDEPLNYRLAMIMYLGDKPVAGMFLEKNTPMELTELTTRHVMALPNYESVMAPMYAILQKWAEEEVVFYKIYSIRSYSTDENKQVLIEKGFKKKFENNVWLYEWINENAEWEKAVDYANQKIEEKRTMDAENMKFSDSSSTSNFSFDVDEDFQLFNQYMSEYYSNKNNNI